MSVSGAAAFYVWDEGWVTAAELCARGRSCWLMACTPTSGSLVPWATAGVQRVAPEGHSQPMVAVTLDGRTGPGVTIDCTADTRFVTAEGLVAAGDLAVGAHLLPAVLIAEAISADCAGLLDDDADYVVAGVEAIDERPALYEVAATGAFLCTVAVAVCCAGEGA